MKKLSLSYILDLIFLFVLSFLVSLVWIRYFLHNVALSLILSFLTSLFVTTVIMLIKIKKSENEYEFNVKKSQLDNLLIYFKITKPDEVLENLKELLTKNNQFNNEDVFEIKKQKDSLLINQKYVFVPHFLCDTISEECVLKLYHKHNRPNLTVIIGTKDKSVLLNSKAVKLIKNLKIFNILDTFNEFYIYSQDSIPNYKTKKEKLTFKKVISLSLSRAKVKPYLICGFCLLFFSFVVRYNLFYIIEATILLILATLSYFSPKKQIA